MKVRDVHKLRIGESKAIALDRIDYAWRHLLPFFGDKDASGVTVSDVQRYSRQRVSTHGAAVGTLRRELGELRASLRYAYKVGKLESTPWIPMPPAPPPRDRWLTIEEVQSLVDHADGRTELFIRIAFATGQRRRVIETLRWEQVDWERRVIDFRKERRDSVKKGSVVPMTKELMNTLRGVYAKRKTGWVLGECTEIAKSFRRAASAAGLEDVTPHTLRHTAISHLVMSGMPLLDVAAFVGCSLRTISTTYAHFATDHLRDQVEYVLQIDGQDDPQDRGL